ncbi:MAG TPA: UbiA family prenyltransferase [Candidatus Limnocylindria bacterium]|jgi:4-hydroxybenzoate polyprenyltransferase|nr:UbiA family prenyltransferase [Candidatus Limnocylindria bacterium]
MGGIGGRGQGLPKAVLALRALHPFPSTLNALLVTALAVLAGAAATIAVGLGMSMLLLQFCIGAVNDLADEPADSLTRPDKPIVAGHIGRRRVATLAVASGGGGLLLAGWINSAVLMLAGAVLAIGLAYDLLLKRTGWGWLAFAAAFPLLPLFAWVGAAGVLPPRAELLLPAAALAGVALQLANGIVDVERDRAVGQPGLAARVGHRSAVLLMAGLLVCVYGVAWTTLSQASGAALFGALVASAAAIAGGGLLAATGTGLREWGWRLEAVALALLAVAWLVAAG